MTTVCIKKSVRGQSIYIHVRSKEAGWSNNLKSKILRDYLFSYKQLFSKEKPLMSYLLNNCISYKQKSSSSNENHNTLKMATAIKPS